MIGWTGFDPSLGECGRLERARLFAENLYAAMGREQQIGFVSGYFFAACIAVDQFVSLRGVFGKYRIFPARKNIVVKKSVQAARILFVLKNIFRHGLNIETGMIVLDPNVVTPIGHF